MSTDFAMNLISGLVGMLLSFSFNLIPGLNDWYYNKIKPEFRGLFMFGVNIVAVGIVMGVSCYNVFPWVSCTQETWITFAQALFFMFSGNQLTYLASPSSPAKKSG